MILFSHAYARESPYGDGNKTRITIFDITDPTAPTVIRTIDTTATFISARRIGSAIHTVLYEEPELLRTLPLVPETITTNGLCTGTEVTGTEPNTYETTAPAEGDAERLVELFDALREENAAAIDQAPPDLVTLDITMPEKSGVAVYRKLKEDDQLKGIPVIIVTGISDDFKKFISTRRHVPPPEGYISKPVDAEEFVSMVRNLLG